LILKPANPQVFGFGGTKMDHNHHPDHAEVMTSLLNHDEFKSMLTTVIDSYDPLR
jgi:hypothetical protein